VSVPFNDLSRQHAPLAGELTAAFARVLSSSAFILGEEVERFEAEFASFCQVKHCVGVSSGTGALTLLLQAAGIGPGDEVIVPAHTFVATALAVVHAGAEPVCVDVQDETGLIDPNAVTAALTPHTAGVLPVHLYGQVCAMDELRDLCRRRGLALFEDAAQAQGATYRGRRAGGLGLAGAFSFYPSKNLGALGDAGAICTSDEGLAARARKLRDLGRSADGRHELAGYNERLSGLQAAFLRVKLPHLERWNEARRRIAARYRATLSGVQLLTERPESPCIYHLFPVRTDSRERLSEVLAEAGIATGVHYPGSLADHPALSQLSEADVPVARDWAARELSLPMFPELSDHEVEAVADAVSLARATAG
jgi:dTDP-3-amino-3,4,6-trideoxy-alpha-D-glucose transaminase